MNKSIGLHLLIYGVALAGLNYLAYRMAPTIAQTALITGLAGGALCIVWGALAVAGRRGKALTLLTLMPVSFFLIAQTVMSFGQAREDENGAAATALMATALVLSFAMLVRVAWAGMDTTPAAQKKP